MTIQQSLLRRVQPYLTRVATLVQHKDLSPVMLERVLMSESTLATRLAEALQHHSRTLRRPVPSSIADAVESFGYLEVVRLALLCGADQAFEHLAALEGHPAPCLQKQARLLAHLMPSMTLRVASSEAKAAMAVGVFGHIGVALLAATLKSDYRQLCQSLMGSVMGLASLETQAFGIDHASAGALLLRECAFPTNVIDAIRDHHRPPTEVGPLAVALGLAEQVGHQMGHDLGLANIAPDPSPAAMEALQLSESELHRMVERSALAA